MRISSSAEKTINWIKANQNPDGGISAWSGHFSYPETSGYLIPTLLDYDCPDVAIRCSKWLISIQNKDGSFNGIDDVPRTFDTGAIVEGLLSLNDKKCSASANKAIEWLHTQRMPNGYLKVQPDQERAEFYTVRVEGILGNAGAIEKWPEPRWFTNGKQRTHYLAYGLEGLLRLGVDITPWLEKLPAGGIAPSYVDTNWQSLGGSDTCATAQIAMLRSFVGLPFDATALYNLQHESGGWPHDTGDNREISWAAKFFLDYEYIKQTQEEAE